MKNNGLINGNGVVYLNVVSLLLLLLLFYHLSSSITECLSFIAYFLILFVGGFGFSLIINQKYEYSSTIYLLISLFVGISLDIILFIILNYLKVGDIYSLVILFISGCILIIVNNKKATTIIKKIKIHKDNLFIVGVFFVILSIFLISDNICYVDDGIYCRDAMHLTYELSIANGLGSMFPAVPDLSYFGKTMKYHFGYPIILYQLINHFNADPLKLVYTVMPAFFLFLFVLFLVEASKIIKRYALRVIFIFSILFSVLSIRLSESFRIIESLIDLPLGAILGAMAPASASEIPATLIAILSTMEAPYFLYQLTFMGSYGLGILFILVLFFLLRNEERNLLLECIILTGMVLIKATFFVPMCAAYMLIFFIDFIQTKNIKKTLKQSAVLIPGIVCFLLFTLGAHKHNLWIIFPGWLHIRTTLLPPEYLIFNMIIAFIIDLIIFLGIGIVYLYPKFKNFISNIIQKRKIAINNQAFYISIIVMSYFFALFFCEVADGNHFQFLFPGYMILSLLAYEYILKNLHNKKLAVIFIILLVFNSSAMVGTQYIIGSNKIYDLDYANNNLLTNIKVSSVKYTFSFLGPRFQISDTFYSNDLMDGLRKLSNTKESGTLLFSRIYETKENGKWNRGPDRWWPSGFIRTALSKKQAVIENYKYKGVLTQPDYNSRSLNNIYFYLIITGNETKINEVNELFEYPGCPHYENLSYYPYLKFFSEENYYTYQYDFFRFIYNNTKTFQIPDKDKSDFVKDYIITNNISYILFERGDEPLDKYKSLLNLELFFDSNKVKIYRVNLSNVSTT